jgi:hypothetical protein
MTGSTSTSAAAVRRPRSIARAAPSAPGKESRYR